MGVILDYPNDENISSFKLEVKEDSWTDFEVERINQNPTNWAVENPDVNVIAWTLAVDNRTKNQIEISSDSKRGTALVSVSYRAKEAISNLPVEDNRKNPVVDISKDPSINNKVPFEKNPAYPEPMDIA